MTMIRFELHDSAANHHKFWAISSGPEKGRSNDWVITCWWGRVGTGLGGQSRCFSFATYDEACTFRWTKISEKTRKGYQVTHTAKPHTVSPPSTEREILASDNKVIKRAYLESLPPLDPEDPFSLPFDDPRTGSR